jgi:1-acyl-sn-glycerol-3-phosphate acyltransferase
MKRFAKGLLKLLGWKLEGTPPEGYQKLLIVEAPHTSNWDYLIGMLLITSVGIKVNVIIKKELFFWPLGPLLKWLGGIPLDRSGNLSKVDALAQLFSQKETLNLAITPEGTRSLSVKWKKGYYFIAVKAGVPIFLTAIDYKRKAGILGPVFYPSGNYEEDFKKIQNFYKGITAKFPEKFNLSPQYLSAEEQGAKGDNS